MNKPPIGKTVFSLSALILFMIMACGSIDTNSDSNKTISKQETVFSTVNTENEAKEHLRVSLISLRSALKQTDGKIDALTKQFQTLRKTREQPEKQCSHLREQLQNVNTEYDILKKTLGGCADTANTLYRMRKITANQNQSAKFYTLEQTLQQQLVIAEEKLQEIEQIIKQYGTYLEPRLAPEKLDTTAAPRHSLKNISQVDNQLNAAVEEYIKEASKIMNVH